MSVSFLAREHARKFRPLAAQTLSILALCAIFAIAFASSAAALEPLRTNGANPRYLANSSGRAVYLAGSYQNPYNLLSGGSESLAAFFDFLVERNHNFTRLWAWEQLEPAEIAAVLGLTTNAVSIRLHRAKKKLGENLEIARKNEAVSGHSHHESSKEERP